MKRVSLVHTVPSVLASFPKELQNAMPENVEIHSTLDEFLAADAAIHGFTQNNLNRIFNIIKAKEMENPDVIAVTCSTLSPAVELVRPFIRVPLVAIDDAMVDKAVKMGKNILIMATAVSTLAPTKAKIAAVAAALSKSPKVTELLCEPAYIAIKQMDIENHDRLLLEAAREIENVDIIILAQASMAHLEEKIQDATGGITTVSSPRLCIQQIKDILF